MIDIVPSIMAPNINVIKERLEAVLGSVKKVQLDIVDGNYASTKTWPFNGSQYDEMREIINGDAKFPFVDQLLIEIDMLVLHPIEYLADFISIGAKSFVIHIDSTDHVNECIEEIKGSGCQVGLGMKPSGSMRAMETYLPQADFVQFMGNDRVGHSGVELDEKVLERIRYFREHHYSMPVQIDIGVNEETIPVLKKLGVSSFVSGSSLFNSSDTREQIQKLQNI